MVKIKRLLTKGILSSVLSASLIFVGVLNNGLLTPVYADTEKTITGLGTGAIVNPTEPLSTTSAWSGSFVYYGNYDVGNDGTAEATKYRVLSVSSNDFGVSGGSLLLDCDSTLYKAKFDENKEANPGALNPNEWAYSDVKSGLNSASFLTKEGNFTAVERASIAGSTKETPSDGDGAGWSYRLGYASLSGDKIFLLDAKEATRTGYGYSNTDNDVTNRVKTGSGSQWWLRSPCSGDDVTCAGEVLAGSVCDCSVSNSQGVSPAFNVNLSSVIFSSKISGTAGQPGAVYKLTLSDNNMEISVPDGSHVSRNGNTITVPYAISGTDFGNADRVSVLIMDEPYTAGKAKTEGYTYLKLDTGTDAFSVDGTGTFTLPDAYSDKVCGTNYYVYILAEDVNEEKETDYASEPVLISVPSSLPKITSQPTNLSLTYGYNNGNTLTVSATADSGHSLSYQWYSNTKDSYKGGAAVDGATSNSYTIPTGKNAGTEYYYCEVTDSTANSTVKSKAAKVTVAKKGLTVTAKDKSIVFGEAPASGGVSYNGFVSGEDESSLSGELSFSFDYEKNGDVGEYSITPSGLYSDNYDISYVKGKLTVNKAPSKLTKAPEGKTGLTFDGKAQELITSGTAEGGTLKYSLKENDGYSEDIPTATEAGGYTVWYKVFGDGNHNDTDAESLSVSIAEKKEEPGKDEKPVIPIPAKNIIINIPEDSSVERDSVIGEGFATDVGESLADAAGSLGKKEEGEESPAPSVEFNKDLSDEEINNYLNNPEKLTISVNSVSSVSLDSDDSRKDAAEEAGLKLANPKAMTSSVEIKIDIYADDGVHIGTVKKLDRGIDLKIDVSGFTEEVISIAKSFLIMSRHTPVDKWFLSGVGEFDPETKTVRKTVREFSEFAVAADSRDVIGIEAEDGLTADKNALDSEIEKLVKDSAKAYRMLKDGEIKYDVPGDVYSVDAKIEPGRTVSQASVAISFTVNEGYRDDYLADPESQESALVELTSSEPEKPAPKPADTNTVTVTVSDNKPMDIRTESLREYQVTYAHEIPFFGKSKPTVENFGGNFTVSKGTEVFKVTKIKINKKKLLIQITGLEGADADTVKAVKKATKGSSGLSFKVNPYYVRDTDTVTTKVKKDGSLKSVKVSINGKDYKAKKTEFEYDSDKKLISFKGNLDGSYQVK